MKVNEIIKNNSKIIENSRDKYKNDNPIVTVIFSTFANHDFRDFQKTVDSILNQTFKKLELIIVDNGMDESIKNSINYYMEIDNRVRCIKHKKAIDSIAISVYEGYIESRGTYISFAFENDVFEKDFIEDSLKIMIGEKCKVSNGVEYNYYNKNKYIAIGERETIEKYNDLLVMNRISMSSIIIDKFVIEEVGMCDPHIVMKDSFDWDIIRRIKEKYIILSTNIKALSKYRNNGNDKRKPINSWCIEERMAFDRSEMLSIKNYLECDIFEYKNLDTKLYIETIRNNSTCKFADNYYTSLVDAKNKFEVKRKIRVLVLASAIDASVCLTFQRILSIKNKDIIFRFCHKDCDFSKDLCFADIIICVRDIYGMKQIINSANELNIPMYYYIDDNFIELKNIFPGIKNNANMLNRLDLNKFKGIFVSTNTLKKYFEEKFLHDNLILLEPILPNDIYEHSYNSKIIKIAFFGGKFREKIFIDIVMPAISKISKGYNVELYYPDSGDLKYNSNISKYKTDKLVIKKIQREIALDEAIKKFGINDIDILIHCGPSLKNNKYKTENSLINAVQLGAVLVASDDFPYSKESELYLLAENNSNSWYEKLMILVGNLDLRKQMYENALKYCKSRYTAESNYHVIYNEIIENVENINTVDVIEKYIHINKNIFNIADFDHKNNLYKNNLYKKDYLINESELIFSKYIKNNRKYKVMSNKNILTNLGLIISSDFQDVDAYLKINIYQKNKFKGSSMLRINNETFNRLTIFEFDEIEIDEKEYFIIELEVKYINEKQYFGVYELKEKRTFFYKVMNKLNLGPKGNSVLKYEVY